MGHLEPNLLEREKILSNGQYRDMMEDYGEN